MFQNCNVTSTSTLKRHCTDTETDFITKKPKLEDISANNNNIDHVDKKRASANCDGYERKKAVKLDSLLLSGHNKNVQIYPSQIVWCRCDKSPFWPAMVWSSKSGKISDGKQRVLVKCFAKKGTNIWMRLDKVFPFDGLESFEKMKNSVDMHLLTRQLKKDYDFAFNITSELWCRAVAEAMHCMSKGREERLTLFVALSSSYKLQKRPKNVCRSRETNTSNRFTVNDELCRVQSFIKDISFPVDESNSEELQSSEELLLKFITESRCSRSNEDDGTDKICNICLSSESTEQLIKCAGTCDGYLHQKCFDNWAPQRLDNRDCEGESTGNLLCAYCSDEWKSLCFVCKSVEHSSQSEIVNCKIANCWRRYHVNCLENWPQAKWNSPDGELHFICPSHECHQCATNPTDIDAKLTNCINNNTITPNIIYKITRCIKCPTTLHNDAKCIQAGTVVLSDSNHICIKHREPRQSITNLDYCYICKVGCNLLRCRTCPHSYHGLCLSTSTFTSISTCAKCQRPVYGDFVWAKLYTYAWWPAIIVPPHCIPSNIRSDDHSPHDICVCFFGDHSYSWIDTQSVHSFDEENYSLYTEKSSKFIESLASARKWFQQAKLIKMGEHTPPPYTKIAKNCLVPPATHSFDSNNEASSCQCHAYDYDDPCGVSSNCVNRASCTECNDLCANGTKCGNKSIQRAHYPEVHLKYFGVKGFGLVTTEAIPHGTIVQQYTGEVVTWDEYESRIQDKMRQNVYFMKYTRDTFLDAETKGSLARFINHSCNPNCLFRVWSVRGENVVVVVAVKDIPKDTEITCKYDWSRNIPCVCREDNCSGFC